MLCAEVPSPGSTLICTCGTAIDPHNYPWGAARESYLQATMLAEHSIGNTNAHLNPVCKQYSDTDSAIADGVQAYAFLKSHFDLHLCASDRSPHTAVRAPGDSYLQATMLAEHLEHTTAHLNPV